MKLYRVTLSADERGELEAITRKGSHQSQKVINSVARPLTSAQRSVLPEYYAMLLAGLIFLV